MGRFKATIEYNGAGFSGSQLQPDARTVQGDLEAATSRINGKPVRVHFSGRTDTGVHALGQVVHFDMSNEWATADLLRALRSVTPEDIHIVDVECADDAFDARRTATRRSYRYVIGVDEGAFSPFRRPFEWALGRPLSEQHLVEAARVFAGRHDFTAFSARGQEKEHHRCLVETSEWSVRDSGNGFIFRVTADRFLHHMVRFMVGTMVEIGLGKRPVGDVGRLLNLDHNSETPAPAPPQGLYLESVTYPAD